MSWWLALVEKFKIIHYHGLTCHDLYNVSYTANDIQSGRNIIESVRNKPYQRPKLLNPPSIISQIFTRIL